MASKKTTEISIFGKKPAGSIFLGDMPYSVRLNCKEGGSFVGGSEGQNRRSNPEQPIDIGIIKVAKYFGSLGKTENVLWLQLFYVPAPWVDFLPKNTVCVSYIKKQSIGNLFNKVQEAMDFGDPGMGIFTLKFNKELGTLGNYYSIQFDWRERNTDEEKQQLEAIAGFLTAFSDRLIDLEGTREMIPIDGLSADQINQLNFAPTKLSISEMLEIVHAHRPMLTAS